MITLVIFLLLSLVEFIIVRLKWSEIGDLHTIGKVASHVTGVGEHYKTITEKIVLFLMRFKPFLWLIVILMGIINLIVAFVLSTLIHIILLFFKICRHSIF